MKTLSRTETYNSTPEKVFLCLDDLGVTGMHMTKWFNKVICFLIGDWYCRWCLKHMLGDCKQSMEANEVEKEPRLQHIEINR
jgi:hypothetical protein